MIERRSLQLCVCIGALVPLVAGITGAIDPSALTGEHLTASGASHMRYLSGLLFAIGLGFWSTIADIQSKGERFHLLTVVVFIGGLFRVIGLVSGPWPSAYMLGGAAMEVLVTPILCAWQMRYAAQYSLVRDRSCATC